MILEANTCGLTCVIIQTRQMISHWDLNPSLWLVLQTEKDYCISVTQDTLYHYLALSAN